MVDSVQGPARTCGGIHTKATPTVSTHCSAPTYSVEVPAGQKVDSFVSQGLHLSGNGLLLSVAMTQLTIHAWRVKLISLKYIHKLKF